MKNKFIEFYNVINYNLYSNYHLYTKWLLELSVIFSINGVVLSDSILLMLYYATLLLGLLYIDRIL